MRFVYKSRSLFVARFALAVALVAAPSVAAPAFAQNLSDLSDPIYRDLEIWQGEGRFRPLPYLQPWPANIVVSALESLLEKKVPAADRLRAERYLSHLNGEASPVEVQIFSELRRGFGSDISGNFNFGVALDVSWRIDPLVHLAILGNPTLVDATERPALPTGARERLDWIPDDASLEIAGREFLVQTRILSLLSLGSEEFSFLAGMGRVNHGPFFDDGISISKDAPFGAYLGYTWYQEDFSFSFLYRPLTASDNKGGGAKAGKHLAFHSLEWWAADWFKVSIYESTVIGSAFNAAYFIPFSGFFLTQGLAGFEGNSLLGLAAEFVPLPGLRVPVTVFIDDMHFNDIVRFEFDTKYKLAFEAGVQWFPGAQDIDFLDKLSLDYTAVMPYMYTHRDGTSQPKDSGSDPDPDYADWQKVYNFANYTHLGTNLATGLQPNSDRIQLSARFTPLEWLRLNIDLKNIRHGDASCGVDGMNKNATGDIFDPGYAGGSATFNPSYDSGTGQPVTRFLTQDVIESSTQISLGAEFLLDSILEFARATVQLSYTFEYRNNADLEEGKTAAGHFVGLGFVINL